MKIENRKPNRSQEYNRTKDFNCWSKKSNL